MKYLILVLLFSSCSVLETASKAVTVPYDIGKLQGRAEVLEELRKNKEQINELKKNLGHHLVEVSLDDEMEVDLIALTPPLVALIQLLENRKALKTRLNELKDVTTPLSESAED